MEIPSGGNINNVVVGNFCFSKVLHTIVTIVFDIDMTWQNGQIYDRQQFQQYDNMANKEVIMMMLLCDDRGTW